MRATVITVLENVRRVGDTRHWPFARAATRHGLPGAAGRVLSTHAPARPSRLLHLLSFASTARSTEATTAPPVPIELRRCCLSSPLQKCVGRLAPRFAVIPSTTSTVQSSQSSLGKGEIAVIFLRRHG